MVFPCVILVDGRQPVKDDNAAKGGPVRSAGMCTLVN